MEKVNKRKLLVFLDVSVDGDPFERMIFELFTDIAPKTAENFRALCTGEKGVSVKTGKPLHYKGTFFHRIIKGYLAQGGDFLRQDGTFGENICGGKFPDEYPKLRHSGPGLLSMATADRDQRGSLFSITFDVEHLLDRKNIVFGKLVEGSEVLKKIENAGDEEGRPAVIVKIVNSGEIHDDAKRSNKKLGKDAIEENNHGVKRKGKHKKTSKKRRKRRKIYSSESESSTDTDTDSSESDTDSDSDSSSLSDTSSSGDDRRKRGRRSKRDRYKRGKKKNRRHEKKRRKRRDKKSKHKSKRNSVSDSETGSKSGGSSQDDVAVGDVKHKISAGNSSPVVEKTSKINDKKWEGADISDREDGEFPQENGDHPSNGIDMGVDSAQTAGRHHYAVDTRPSKSRSRSASPVRTSTSPRTAVRSPSPSVSRSPQQISGRSMSNTPARSGGSISPRPRPPARSRSQRSRSRSATVSPPRRRVIRSPPRNSSKRSSLRSASRSPVRSSRRSISRSPVRAPPRRSPSQSPSPSPVRAPSRRTIRPSHSGSPVSAGRRARSPSRSPSVDGNRIRRGRGFSDRFTFARRSPDRSPVRPYRYGGRNDRDRYSSYRRSSPRRYRSPPRGRTPPRYRGRRSKSRSPSVSRSPVRFRGRRYSKSPIRSRSPVRRRSPSRSRSLSKSLSPRHSSKVNPKSSPSASASPPRKTGLVSYGNASPDSSRD
ncbi:hypothetical protein ACP275_05G130700 [Erythranthe tilingii]